MILNWILEKVKKKNYYEKMNKKAKNGEPEDNAPENHMTGKNYPKYERRLTMPSTRTCEQIALQD